MAEALDGYKFAGSAPKYPWDQWANGQIWRIKRGTDFNCPRDAIRNSIYMTAKRMGLKARVNMEEEEGALVFQFYKNGEVTEATD